MALSIPTPILWVLAAILLFAKPTLAFGAGNIAGISSVEGVNWRHGDIEDTLLNLIMARSIGGKKFDKLMVSRVYFGNWLRDYSQAIDVGTVKNVSAEAIRLLLCVLGFMTFGYGSREFEVRAERLGTYRPEDHIDNPKNYADNIDARQYDQRLRGPVDERVELAIDRETGMKNYIANERVNIMTSALHVRKLFGGCIQLGRQYARSGRKEDLYEALRLMGTGLHCLEDFLAHSNYVELALIEMGERDVFPHVGRRTLIRLQGARQDVYPVVTGTFGGADFLHSVTGELSDKMTQNEIDELEGSLQQSQNSDTSLLRELLDMLPDGLFGGGDKKQQMSSIQNNANTAQMQQARVSPRQPEEYTAYIRDIFQQVMPAIEFHDEIMMTITEAVEKIPILPKVIDQLEDQLSIFVFSVIAPFVVPVINQIKNELRTGSEEIIQGSEAEQHIVFNNDQCSDPTHSILSKDHFSNILNEVAGTTASAVVGWAVPQLMQCIDDERSDPERTVQRIIQGVMHHPAQREMGQDGARDGRQLMFRNVETWWRNMDEGQRQDYRRKLTRDGVMRDENHKEGVQDTGHGHGCNGKLTMHKQFGSGGNTMEDKIANAAAGAIIGGVTTGLAGLVAEETGGRVNMPKFNNNTDRVDGSLEGMIGGVANLLGSEFSGNKSRVETYESRPQRTQDGGWQQTVEQFGRSEDGGRYGQAEYTETRYDDGRDRREYSRTEQNEAGYGGGSGYRQSEESRPTYGGGYQEERREERWGGGGNEYRREESNEYGGGGGYGGAGYQQEERRQEQSWGNDRQDNYGGGNQYDNDRRDDDQGGGDAIGNFVEGAVSNFFGGGNREERREEGGGGWFS